MMNYFQFQYGFSFVVVCHNNNFKSTRAFISNTAKKIDVTKKSEIAQMTSQSKVVNLTTIKQTAVSLCDQRTNPAIT